MTVDVFATAGGKDTAFMYDSAGDDEFVAQGSIATMRGMGFETRVHHFEVVYGQSINGGIDTATSVRFRLVTTSSPTAVLLHGCKPLTTPTGSSFAI